jgi:hypothetical protein
MGLLYKYSIHIITYRYCEVSVCIQIDSTVIEQVPGVGPRGFAGSSLLTFQQKAWISTFCELMSDQVQTTSIYIYQWNLV